MTGLEVFVKQEFERILKYHNLFKFEKSAKIGVIETNVFNSKLKVAIFYANDFGYRLVNYLINPYKYCTACGEHKCIGYECRYGKFSFSKNIVYVCELPKPYELPMVIDEPLKYLPNNLPNDIDVFLATGLHNDLYFGLVELARKNNVKAIIILREDPQDTPYGVLEQLKDLCKNYDIEITAPKPPCSLIPDKINSSIFQFVKEFRIGRPIIEIDVKNNIFHEVGIKISTPCGLTWYLLKNLRYFEFKDLNELYQVIANLHHSYPCLGSMKYDYELGDTVLHWAQYICRESVLQALNFEKELSETIKERLMKKSPR